MGIAAAFAASVGLYMYWSSSKAEGTKKDRTKDVSADELYAALYPLSMSDEDARGKETAQNLEDDVVEEVTPKGKLLMKYMESDNTFLYWSDKSQDYKYLEVAARKYVILFGCRDKYVDMVDELVKERDRRVRETERSPMQSPMQSAARSSVFATFKQYATKDSRKIANRRSNAYKWKGKLGDYATPSDKAQQSQPPGIRYSEYKRKI